MIEVIHCVQYNASFLPTEEGASSWQQSDVTAVNAVCSDDTSVNRSYDDTCSSSRSLQLVQASCWSCDWPVL